MDHGGCHDIRGRHEAEARDAVAANEMSEVRDIPFNSEHGTMGYTFPVEHCAYSLMFPWAGYDAASSG